MQSPVVDDFLLNFFQGTLIGTADQKGTVDGAIELLRNVAVVSPDFGIIRCVCRIENADDFPVCPADVNRIADFAVLEAVRDGPAHEDLAQSGLQHPAVH